MRYPMKTLVGCVSVSAALLLAGPAMAVPYASGVTSDGGTGFNFVLNEPADSVIVTRDGVAMPTIVAAASGIYNFDMNGFSDYEIAVTHTAAAGWVESPSSVGNTFLEFERANGMAVNKNPGSSNFGRLYVANRSIFPTVSLRQMGDGVYVMNADGSLQSGSVNANDTTEARNAGLNFTLSSNSPWKLTIGEDDTVYIADWSDASGGIKYADADLSPLSGKLLLAGESGNPLDVPLQNHGSIVSKVNVSGSIAGGDLVVYAMDEDMPGSIAGTGNHMWSWNVGGTTENFAGAPTLLLDASTEGVNLDPNFGATDGNPILLDLNIGVFVDVFRDPNSGKFYITQPRDDGNESGLVIVDTDGSTILWNSMQFSMDNSLDQVVDDIFIPQFDGVQDILRLAATAEVSPDGSTLAIHRRRPAAENVFLGIDTVLLIPLDANGLPVFDLTDPVLNPMLGVTGVPATTINHHTRAETQWDLAGNLYASSNSSEKVTIFGPGGASSATTRSDGSFTINGVTHGGGGCGALVGDYNCDGFVGIEDLNLVLSNWNATVTPFDKLAGDGTGDGFVGIEDLNEILGNWNAGTPPPPGSVVPEPATLALLGLGGVAMLRRRR